jgi:DNA-binding beta-propeller fold protein YncE
MRWFAWIVAAVSLCLGLGSALAEGPTFKVDPFWPKPLPNSWILGQVAGVAVDAKQHIWIIHRPRSLSEDEKGAISKERHSKCCIPAPPVIEFDQAGNVVQAWGGPGQGFEWPEQEHGIRVDYKDTVWLGGNGRNDGMVLRFTRDGKFIKQFGHLGPNKGSLDKDQMGQVADFAIDAPTNEVYFADGYGNHRVIVFDADTGAFKRMWGAYGKPPTDEKLPGYDANQQQFANPVHCVKIASDGLVYVCDRVNNRVQVFQKDGTFVRQFVYEPETRGSGSTWDLELWPDKLQSYLVMVDGSNNEMRTIRRKDGAVTATVGRSGRMAGQFHWVHNIAIDRGGNVYTTEVDNAKRVQKWVPAGPKPR